MPCRTVPSALIDDLPGETMTEVLEWLQRTYTSSIGYEFEHLEDPESREWLREQIESGEHCRPLGDEDAGCWQAWWRWRRSSSSCTARTSARSASPSRAPT
jgi:hypothetical protein